MGCPVAGTPHTFGSVAHYVRAAASGAAALRSCDTFTTTNGLNSFTSDSDDDGAWGWQAGAGAEYRLPDSMSMGVEYLYTSLSDDDYVVRAGPGTAPATNACLIANANGTDLTREDDRFDFHTVRATLTYRFDE
jgi:outer membrane immunogenic protein